MGVFDRWRGRRSEPGEPLAPVDCPASSVVPDVADDDVVDLLGRAFHAVRPVPMTGDRPADAPAAMWIGRGDTDFLVHATREYPRSGLWPVVLDDPPGGLDGDGLDGSWLDDVLDPHDDPAGAVASFDARDLLAAWWDDNRPLGSDAPAGDERDERWFRTFPGLARLTADRPTGFDDWQQHHQERLVALVPAARPADVPAVLGWWGAANHDQSGPQLSAVLRSWEDRFGAVLVGLGFDTLVVVPARAASDDDEALHLAAEHLAFCSDNVFQGPGSVPDYAAWVVDRLAWSFWWD